MPQLDAVALNVTVKDCPTSNRWLPALAPNRSVPPTTEADQFFPGGGLTDGVPLTTNAAGMVISAEPICWLELVDVPEHSVSLQFVIVIDIAVELPAVTEDGLTVAL